MSMSASMDHQKQLDEAEQLLGDQLQRASFAKGLFFGQYLQEKFVPYPRLRSDAVTNEWIAAIEQFCRDKIDPAAIDQDADIPRSVIEGLGKLGVLGAGLPVEVGGRGQSQTAYCRALEVLGGHCGSTALFVNAHHSIGPRALVLFGTPDQQRKWLPKLATGHEISAFALTEPSAGSDAANVQTMAVPTSDGTGYLISGEKRWITNGSIARVLTVMARTPVPESRGTQVTAFVVTPDMPGFEVIEARMPKMGCRGTVTSRLKFTNMFIPRENVLGPLGKGLRVALTVLDFGRTTFGACCTGAAKFCCRRSASHTLQRVQFGKKLASFELVKQKIATMHADTYAMEAATYQTAALIDAGRDDYMLETAMLKVFTTEALWRILGDTFQIHGGMAYFQDQPFERMIRDARINTIGEGSNDVLRVFLALVGIREAGLELQQVAAALRRPLRNLPLLAGFAGRRVEGLFNSPRVTVRSAMLESNAQRMGRLVSQLGADVDRLLRTQRESTLDAQAQLVRVADAATELYVSACVLARLDRLVCDDTVDECEKKRKLATGTYYLSVACRRIQQNLAALWDHDDDQATKLAELVYGGALHNNEF